MVALIYRAYYIYFLHYSKSEMGVAWFSSIIAISTALMVLLLSISYEIGVLKTMTAGALLKAVSKAARKRIYLPLTLQITTTVT